MIHYFSDKKLNEWRADDDRILLIGDQVMNLNQELNWQHGVYARDHYPKATDIDYNGEAELTFDLSKRLGKRQLDGIGQFDIALDAGSGEHIENLMNFLLNVNAFLINGGISIHFNPAKGAFPGHGNDGGGECYHWFTQQFWRDVAPILGFELVQVGEQEAYHHPVSNEVWAVLQKKESVKYSARLKEKFQELYDKHIFGDPMKKTE